MKPCSLLAGLLFVLVPSTALLAATPSNGEIDLAKTLSLPASPAAGPKILAANRELLRRYQEAGSTSGESTDFRIPENFPLSSLAGKKLKVVTGQMDRVADDQIFLKTDSGKTIPLDVQNFSQLWVADAGRSRLAELNNLPAALDHTRQLIAVYVEGDSQNMVLKATDLNIESEIAPPDDGAPPIPVVTPNPPPTPAPAPNK